MPFPFACPNCGLETLVDDEFAGQTGPCAGCGKDVTVPHRLGMPLLVEGITPTAGRVKPLTIATIVILSIVAASMVFAILLILVFPSFQVAGELLHKSTCRSNLQRIAEALKQYEIEHGTLPPAYIADPVSGKPMHSWRILILPQLGEDGLYQQYDFNQAWDGPTNSQLVRQMPDVYACPADPDAKSKYETSYMVLVGPKTLFTGAKPLRTADITDGTETTILVTETPVAGIVWMEPKDLNASRMQFTINDNVNGEIGSHHRGGAHAVMVDGSVRFLDDTFPTDYLQGMSTPQGSEQVPWEVLE